MATTHPPAVRAPTRPTRPPDLTAFTVVHRALRRDGARLALALEGLGAGDTARARALQRWFAGFRNELDGHHTVEDHLWFPLLADRVPTFAEHTDRIAREHQMLDDAVRGVTLALDRLVEEAAPLTRRLEAHGAACELSSLLDAHLGFEDADILPLYLRHFTADEFAEVERLGRSYLVARRLPFSVPWVMSAATPAERARLLDGAPVGFNVVWVASRRRHARLSTRALGPSTKGVA